MDIIPAIASPIEISLHEVDNATGPEIRKKKQLYFINNEYKFLLAKDNIII